MRVAVLVTGVGLNGGCYPEIYKINLCSEVAETVLFIYVRKHCNFKGKMALADFPLMFHFLCELFFVTLKEAPQGQKQNVEYKSSHSRPFDASSHHLLSPSSLTLFSFPIFFS